MRRGTTSSDEGKLKLMLQEGGSARRTATRRWLRAMRAKIIFRAVRESSAISRGKQSRAEAPIVPRGGVTAGSAPGQHLSTSSTPVPPTTSPVAMSKQFQFKLVLLGKFVQVLCRSGRLTARLQVNPQWASRGKAPLAPIPQEQSLKIPSFSLVLRFVKDQFDDYRESTIGGTSTRHPCGMV